MAGDLVSLSQQLLGEGGFITFLNTPAGEPLRRIFSAGGRFVASQIDAASSKRESKTAGETTVDKALAEAGASQLAGNSELARRAGERLLAKELRAQANLEAIASLTWKNVKDDPSVKASPGPSEDFNNNFEDIASNASSEDLRRLFARILSGEIRSPGSVSLATLRFASIIDIPLAQLIQSFADDLFVDKIFAVGRYRSGKGLLDMREMESHNLLSTDLNMGHQGGKIFSLRGSSLIITEGGAVPIALLTRLGKEIFSLFDCSFEKERSLEIAHEIKGENKKVNVSVADILEKSDNNIKYTQPVVIT